MNSHDGFADVAWISGLGPEQAMRFVRTQLRQKRWRRRRDHPPPDRQPLVHLVRNHPQRLVAGAEDAEDGVGAELGRGGERGGGTRHQPAGVGARGGLDVADFGERPFDQRDPVDVLLAIEEEEL